MTMFVKEKKGRYITILSDGKFHESVQNGTTDAVLREYETSDGKTGSKWELVYAKIIANIVDVRFKDGDYGEQLIIGVEGDEGTASIQVNAESPFGESIMKLLPNVQFDKPVDFSPYAFPSDKDPDKKIRGISFFQDGFNVENYFYDGKENKNDFPNPPKPRDEMTTKLWKIYFMEASEFLINYTKENICPKFSEQGMKDLHHNKALDNALENSDPNEIPF